MNTATDSDRDQEHAIAQVIACHYGDGDVYVPRSAARRAALRLAIDAGFVSREGFLTREGRRLLARFQS
ncbi:MAG: hypothetical protein WD928_01535 [Gammaproteobacteria bacterium]